MVKSDLTKKNIKSDFKKMVIETKNEYKLSKKDLLSQYKEAKVEKSSSISDNMDIKIYRKELKDIKKKEIIKIKDIKASKLKLYKSQKKEAIKWNKYTSKEIAKDEYQFSINDKTFFVNFREKEEELSLHQEDVLKFEEYETPLTNIKYILIRSIDGTYKYMYKIEPIDFLSLSIDAQNRILEEYYLALKSFQYPLKLVTMNNFYDLHGQIKNLKESSKKHFDKKILREYNREVAKLKQAEKMQQISFYFLIFGNDKEDVLGAINSFENIFKRNFFEWNRLTLKENKEVIKRMNNL